MSMPKISRCGVGRGRSRCGRRGGVGKRSVVSGVRSQFCSSLVTASSVVSRDDVGRSSQ